jgi:hypothetical protein
VKFSIIHIEELSGAKAQIYTLKYEGKYVSELQSFIYKFQDTHSKILDEVVQRIHTISKRNGIEESFFLRECPESHNVFRLLETSDLRIYCIMFSNVVLLFGSGGPKKPGTKKLIENPALDKEVKKLMKIEDAVNKRIKSGELNKTIRGLEGNLNDIEL